MTDAKPYLFNPPCNPLLRPGLSNQHLLFLSVGTSSCVHRHHSNLHTQHGPDNMHFLDLYFVSYVCVLFLLKVLVSVLEVIDTSLYFLLWERKLK